MKCTGIFLAIVLTFSSQANGEDARVRADGAAAALMRYYKQSDGLFDTTGWWNSANAITAILDYMYVTGSREYLSQVEHTFEVAGGNRFTNEFIDDCGWWGLAWVRAYDLTNDQKYLNAAEYISDYMYQYKDNQCNGGLPWKTDRQNKNAVPNELFIKLAASIHNRLPGDTKYLNQAVEIWNWFKNTGMINRDLLINDGLKDLSQCQPDGPTFSYNQGIILGGLTELYIATNDGQYIDQAVSLADASSRSGDLNQNGILHEIYENDNCDWNGDLPSFKGVYVRNLAELTKALPNNPYHDYLEKNAQSAYDNSRNQDNQYGWHWDVPMGTTTAACQHTALDLMNAALSSAKKISHMKMQPQKINHMKRRPQNINYMKK